MGVFLLLIAVAGLVGAINHHQVLLFFVSLPKVMGHYRTPGRAEWARKKLDLRDLGGHVSALLYETGVNGFIAFN